MLFSGISFTPQEVGEHLVSVKKRGRHVSNSPFSVMVGASEIADASKVKVYGEGCEKAVAGETAAFKVDTRKAGGQWVTFVECNLIVSKSDFISLLVEELKLKFS